MQSKRAVPKSRGLLLPKYRKGKGVTLEDCCLLKRYPKSRSKVAHHQLFDYRKLRGWIVGERARGTKSTAENICLGWVVLAASLSEIRSSFTVDSFQSVGRVFARKRGTASQWFVLLQGSGTIWPAVLEYVETVCDWECCLWYLGWLQRHWKAKHRLTGLVQISVRICS
jgi:hypothetical protein